MSNIYYIIQTDTGVHLPGRQSIAGHISRWHSHLRDNLKSNEHEIKRKPEITEGTHADTGEHSNSTQKDPDAALTWEKPKLTLTPPPPPSCRHVLLCY